MLDHMSTFVRTLLAPYDVMAMLDGLTSHVSQMLQLHGAGVTVIRPDTPLELITAAPPDLVKLEETQKESGAGPCVEAFRTGELQRVEDLASQSERWPEYSAAALAMNVKAVAGIPMRLGDRTVGALNLYSARELRWRQDTLDVAGIFADVATVYLLNSLNYDRQVRINQQLQEALQSRVVIEQAKGMVAESHKMDVEEAFELIRRHARSHHTTLRSVAEAIVHLRMRL